MQLLPDGECVGDGIAHDAIDVGARVEADRLRLRGVGLSVGKRRFLDRAVDDLPDDVAVLLVHRDELAFEDERQLVDDRRVDELALREREAALGDLVGRLVAADESQVVAGR